MTAPTNYDHVVEFHKCFGHPQPNTLQRNVFDENKPLINLRLSLIQEEVTELKCAIEDKNIVQVADALTDILYVVYGAGVALGIDLDKCFELVHENNMSKLCKTKEEAHETIEHYKTLKGFENVQVNYRLADDGKHYVIFNEATGKILKAKSWVEPDFSKILE